MWRRRARTSYVRAEGGRRAGGARACEQARETAGQQEGGGRHGQDGAGRWRAWLQGGPRWREAGGGAPQKPRNDQRCATHVWEARRWLEWAGSSGVRRRAWVVSIKRRRRHGFVSREKACLCLAGCRPGSPVCGGTATRPDHAPSEVEGCQTEVPPFFFSLPLHVVVHRNPAQAGQH